MLLRSHPSEFAENWAIPFVNKPSTPMMADRKAELFRMQAQNQKIARQAPLEQHRARRSNDSSGTELSGNCYKGSVFHMISWFTAPPDQEHI
jgi:hypothetical protein